MPLAFLIAVLALPATPTLTVPQPPADTVSISSTTPIEAYIALSATKHGVDAYQLLATLQCESGLDPHAINTKEGSFGIAQIHLVAHKDITIDQAFDWQWSVDWAAEQFSKGRQSMWTCYVKQFGDIADASP